MNMEPQMQQASNISAPEKNTDLQQRLAKSNAWASSDFAPSRRRDRKKWPGFQEYQLKYLHILTVAAHALEVII